MYYRIHEGQEKNNNLSYLYNNYRYVSDALHNLNLSLTDKEKCYLQHKNKRRFVMNLFKYVFETGKLLNALKAIKISGFRIHDLLDALITKQLPVSKI